MMIVKPTCRGGAYGRPSGLIECGKPATVYCRMHRNGLDWFACDDGAHRTGAELLEPVDEHLERLLFERAVDQLGRNVPAPVDRGRGRVTLG